MRRTGVRDIGRGATAAQWRELVERFERAGQSRGEFCAAHRWALSPFDLWRRKLRATPAAVEEASPEALFVELINPAQSSAGIFLCIVSISVFSTRVSRSAAPLWCTGRAAPSTCWRRSPMRRVRMGSRVGCWRWTRPRSKRGARRRARCAPGGCVAGVRRCRGGGVSLRAVARAPSCARVSRPVPRHAAQRRLRGVRGLCGATPRGG